MNTSAPIFPRVNPSTATSHVVIASTTREPNTARERSQQQFRVQRLHTAPSLRLNPHSLEQPLPTYARSSTAPLRRRQFALTRGDRSLTLSSLLTNRESSGASLERSLTGATLATVERSYTGESFVTARSGATFGLGPLDCSYTGILGVLREAEDGSGEYIRDSQTDPDLRHYRLSFDGNADLQQEQPIPHEVAMCTTSDGIPFLTSSTSTSKHTSGEQPSISDGTGRRKRTRMISKKPDPLIERLFTKGFGAYADAPPRDPNAAPPQPEMPTAEESDTSSDPRTIAERFIAQTQERSCKWVDRLRKWLMKVRIETQLMHNRSSLILIY